MTGLALNPKKIDSIIGVVKAYTTRVGGGPFATEDTKEIGTTLQDIGRVTTGRKRRCGWLDLIVAKYSAAVNHYSSLNLTKLDVLDTFPTIKVAIGYKDTVRNEKLESFPASLDILERVEVEYKEFEGWQMPITGKKRFEELPQECQDYVKFIEEFVGVKLNTLALALEETI